MPDKIKLQNVGTFFHPKYEVVPTPNLGRGRDEYNKGNYLDSDAKAYAESISGKANSVSPEFDLLGVLGIKTFAQAAKAGLSYLFKDSSKHTIRKGSFSGINIRRGNTDLKYTGSNAHYQRVKNGSYKNLGLTKEQADDVLDDLYDNTVNLDNYTNYRELAKDLDISEKKAKLIMSYDDNIFFEGIRNNGDGLIFYKGSKIDQNTFNYLLPHEVHHGLSFKSLLLNGDKPMNIPNPDKTSFINYTKERGIRSKRVSDDYYNYMTGNKAEEMSARGTQLKNELGITKDRAITPEELKELSETYPNKIDNDMRAFFSLIGNNYKDWAKWLSSTATGYTGLIMSNSKDDKENEK